MEQRSATRVEARTLTGVLGLLVLPLAAIAFLRFTGIGGHSYIAATLALTPYLAGGGLLIGLLTLYLRRWRIGAALLVLTVLLAATLLPRVLPDDQPLAEGATLRVMAVNLYFGRADAAAVVEQARRHNVDALCLLELTPSAVFRLQDAGLFDVLPNQRLRQAEGAGGVGIVSRYPLNLLPTAPSTLTRLRAAVELPEGGAAEVVAVHAVPPVQSIDEWASDLASLPQAPPDGVPRVLAGDFNATLDHAAMREVLDRGYVDAAAQLGEGFDPTWPDGIYPPPVTIDHILAGELAAVRDYEALDIPGSDHNAVYAELTLPR